MMYVHTERKQFITPHFRYVGLPNEVNDYHRIYLAHEMIGNDLPLSREYGILLTFINVHDVRAARSIERSNDRTTYFTMV